MGYNSDVSIAVYGDEAQMLALIAAQRIKGAKWLEDEHEINEYSQSLYGKPDIKTPMVMILAKFDGIKWYDGYEDVDCWTALLEDARENFSANVNTEFVRVGEETEDTETFFTGDNLYYYTGVSREILTNLPQFAKEAA